MTDNSWLSAIPLISLVLLLVFLYETKSRQQPHIEPPQIDAPAAPKRASIALLCTFVCAVGTIWLVPWAAALPGTGASGLLPGVLFVAFLSIGVFCALRDVDAQR